MCYKTMSSFKKGGIQNKEKGKKMWIGVGRRVYPGGYWGKIRAQI